MIGRNILTSVGILVMLASHCYPQRKYYTNQDYSFKDGIVFIQCSIKENLHWFIVCAYNAANKIYGPLKCNGYLYL